jgi:hypothetical protein
MRTVTITMRRADFAGEMGEMRTWLDQHMLEPARYTYREEGESVVISVDFQNDHHAEAFKSRFGQLSGVSIPLRSEHDPMSQAAASRLPWASPSGPWRSSGCRYLSLASPSRRRPPSEHP